MKALYEYGFLCNLHKVKGKHVGRCLPCYKSLGKCSLKQASVSHPSRRLKITSGTQMLEVAHEEEN